MCSTLASTVDAPALANGIIRYGAFNLVAYFFLLPITGSKQ
jgi:hypothetical protein